MAAWLLSWTLTCLQVKDILASKGFNDCGLERRSEKENGNAEGWWGAALKQFKLRGESTKDPDGRQRVSRTIGSELSARQCPVLNSLNNSRYLVVSICRRFV